MSLQSLVRGALEVLLRPVIPTSLGELGGVDLSGVVELDEKPSVIARRLLGLEGRLPSRGTDERRAYDRLVRRFYRRGATPAPLSREVLRRAARASRRAQVELEGTRNRIGLTTNVASPGPGKEGTRTRTLPTGGPGVYIPGDVMAELLELYDADSAELGAQWLGTFGAHYGWELDEDDVEEVSFVSIWLPGEGEPGA